MILVFVDYAGKGEYERPDFYVLTVQDWIEFARKIIAKFPQKGIVLDAQNVPVWTMEKNAQGQPYRGTGVKVEDIQEHKEKWSKILDNVGQLRDDE